MLKCCIHTAFNNLPLLHPFTQTHTHTRSHTDSRLQAKFQTCEKEEFDILNYHYLINNDLFPRFIGWVVRGAGWSIALPAVKRMKFFSSDTVVNLFSCGRQLLMSAPPPPWLASTKNGHAKNRHVYSVLTAVLPRKLSDWYLKHFNLEMQTPRGV